MSKDIKARFSEKLRRLRNEAGLSVSDLAKVSKVSRQHIRDLEMPIPQKRVTIITLEKLAKGLRIPIWKLLKF
ncbi:MAG: helix-turn-helix domain-containing protein [Candidatus Omnitrophica bacterium]|nr:helix-turn-helix domain-containing protein [Candidatus Omnitrophota bacterium]